MTTTTDQATAWFDQIVPAEMRSEVDDLIVTINRFTTEIAPHLERARELLARFELDGHHAAQAFGKGSSAAEGAIDLINAVTGHQELYDAMTDLGDACDPCTHPLYAAVASPGQLRMNTAVVVTDPSGRERMVFVTDAGDRTFRALDVEDPSGTQWEITHDELIAGVRRGMALAGDQEVTR